MNPIEGNTREAMETKTKIIKRETPSKLQKDPKG